MERVRSQAVPIQHLPAEVLHVPFAHVARKDGRLVEIHLSGALPDLWPLQVARGFAAGRFNLLNGSLLEVALAQPSARGGELELEVQAWDSVGLLAAVLGHVNECDLVPSEILLETEEGFAFHRLGLRSRGWGVPTARQRRALAQRLSRMLRAA